MATVVEISTVRLLVSEPDDTGGYTDTLLTVRIDAAGSNLDLVARDIWVEKAAAYAALPDISEAGSSRSMSKLYDNAMRMVAYFNKKLADDAVTTPDPVGTRIRKLTR